MVTTKKDYTLLGQRLVCSISYWDIRIGEDTISIIPRKSRLIDKLVIVSLILIGCGFLIFIARHNQEVLRVFIIFTGVFSCFTVIFLLAMDAYQIKKEPFLVWHKKERKLELPQGGLEFESDEIICFQQLTAPSTLGDMIVELNVFARKNENEKERYPIISATAAKQMEKVSLPLSETTGIPLEIVNNDLHNPFFFTFNK